MTENRLIISSERISVLSSKADIAFCGDRCGFCSLDVDATVGKVTSRRILSSAIYEHDFYRQGEPDDQIFPFMSATDHLSPIADAFVRSFEGCGELNLTLSVNSGIEYELLCDYPIGDVSCDCVYMHSSDGRGVLMVTFGKIVLEGHTTRIRVTGNSVIAFVLGSKAAAVRAASSLMRSLKRSLKMAQRQEILPVSDAQIDEKYLGFIESSASFLRHFYKNQACNNASELYFALRALCALGLFADAKDILCRLLSHSSDELDAKAYFLLSADVYFSRVDDGAFLSHLLPSIESAAESLIRASRRSLMHPFGNEREFKENGLPAANLHCASARSTLMLSKALLCAHNLIPWGNALYLDCAEKASEALKSTFIRENGASSFAVCREFDRKTRFRVGFCDKCVLEGRYAIETLERSGDMRYLCDKCFADQRIGSNSSAPKKADTDLLLPYDKCALIASGYITPIEDLAYELASVNDLDSLGILLLYCTKKELPIAKSIIDMLFAKMGSDDILFFGASAEIKANAMLCEALALYFKI